MAVRLAFEPKKKLGRFGAVERADDEPLHREVSEPPQVVHALRTADRLVVVHHRLSPRTPAHGRGGVNLLLERPLQKPSVSGLERPNRVAAVRVRVCAG